MADEIASVTLQVDSRPVDKAVTSLDRLSKAGNRAQSSLDGMMSKAQQASASLGTMSRRVNEQFLIAQDKLGKSSIEFRRWVNGLRTEFVPLAAAQQKYVQSLNDLNLALKAGAFKSIGEYRAALRSLKGDFKDEILTLKGVNGARTQASQMQEQIARKSAVAQVQYHREMEQVARRSGTAQVQIEREKTRASEQAFIQTVRQAERAANERQKVASASGRAQLQMESEVATQSARAQVAYEKEQQRVARESAKAQIAYERGQTAQSGAYNNELAGLRKTYNPMQHLDDEHQKTLTKMNAALVKGDISQAEHSKMVENLNSKYVHQARVIERAQSAHAGYTKELGLSANQLTNLSYQINDVVSGAMMGQSAFQIFTQQIGQFVQVFQSSDKGIMGSLKGLGSYILQLMTPLRLVAAGIAGIGIAGVTALASWDSRMVALQRSLNGIGAAGGLTRDRLYSIAKSASDQSGLSYARSSEAAGVLASAGLSGPTIGGALGGLQSFGRQYGGDSKENAEAIAKILRDPTSGLEELAKKTGYVSGALQEEVRHLQNSGRLEDARALVLREWLDSLKRGTDSITKMGAVSEASSKFISNLNVGMGDVLARIVSPTSAQKIEDALSRPNRRTFNQLRDDGLRDERRRLGMPYATRQGELGRALISGFSDASRTAHNADLLESRRVSGIATSTVRGLNPDIQSKESLQEQLSKLSLAGRDPEALKLLGVTLENFNLVLDRTKTSLAEFETSWQKMVTDLDLATAGTLAYSMAEQNAISSRQTELQAFRNRLSYSEAAILAEKNRAQALAATTNALRDSVKEADLSIRLLGKNSLESERIRIEQDRLQKLRTSTLGGAAPSTVNAGNVNDPRLDAGPANNSPAAIDAFNRRQIDKAAYLKTFANEQGRVIVLEEQLSLALRESESSFNLQISAFGKSTAEVAKAAEKQKLLNQAYRDGGSTLVNLVQPAVERQARAVGNLADRQRTFLDIRGPNSDFARQDAAREQFTRLSQVSFEDLAGLNLSLGELSLAASRAKAGIVGFETAWQKTIKDSDLALAGTLAYTLAQRASVQAEQARTAAIRNGLSALEASILAENARAQSVAATTNALRDAVRESQTSIMQLGKSPMEQEAIRIRREQEQRLKDSTLGGAGPQASLPDANWFAQVSQKILEGSRATSDMSLGSGSSLAKELERYTGFGLGDYKQLKSLEESMSRRYGTQPGGAAAPGPAGPAQATPEQLAGARAKTAEAEKYNRVLVETNASQKNYLNTTGREISMNYQMSLSLKEANAAMQLQYDNFGKSTGEVAAANERQKQINAAYREGGDALVAKMLPAIDAYSQKMGALAVQQRDFNELLQRMGEIRSMTGDFITTFVGGMARGESAAKALKSAVQSLLQGLIRMASNQLLQGLFGRTNEPGTGFLGSFLGKMLGMGGGGPIGADYTGPNIPDFAMGGIMTSSGKVPLNKYSAGGVANSPQMALFGEGRTPEAYVPLPDGRNIPVRMQAATNGLSAGGRRGVGDTNIKIVNNAGADVKTNTSRDNNGNQMIEFILDKVAAAEASGRFDQTRKARYGMAPSKKLR